MSFVLLVVPTGLKERIRRHHNASADAARQTAFAVLNHLGPEKDFLLRLHELFGDVTREPRSGKVVRIEVHEDVRAFKDAATMSHVLGVRHAKRTGLAVLVERDPAFRRFLKE